MNKSELVERLGENAKITKKRAEQVVNLVFEMMSEALSVGDRIEIRGFGSFTCKSYDAYTGRNPRTGETIHVPSKRLPFFKVGKELKERVDYPPGSERPGLDPTLKAGRDLENSGDSGGESSGGSFG
jgi:integration host factor subunit beta